MADIPADIRARIPADSGAQQGRTFFGFVAGMLFFSGFAALVYQVVWMRHLSLFFGSDVYAAALTLSVFMGGLCAGSLLAQRFIGRVGRPLLWYGWIEIGIGVYALSFRSLLATFTPLLEQVYRSQFEAAPAAYQATRIGVAALVMLLPTTLMGATLPLVVKSFVQRDAESGRFGGTFYAINTFGALAGTLLAAFVLIPFLGVGTTTLVAVAINVLIGVLVVLLSGRSGARSSSVEAAPDEERAGAWRHDPSAARVALLAIATSGLAALALEVVWTRILTLSFSGTVYSFAIMLASFLFGISYGSRLAARTIDSEPDPVRTFAFVQLWLGFSVALLGLGAYAVPRLSGPLLWAVTGLTQGNFALGAITAQIVIGGGLIVVPTMLLGATFPAAVRICTPDARQAGRSTARVYAANTAGAIVGSLLAGFVLIPGVGSRAALVVLALVFSANGCLLARHSGSRARTGLFPRVAALGGATLVTGFVVLLLPRQTVANYGLQQAMQPESLYHGEGLAHSVDIVRAASGNIIMLVDGNTEADTSFVQRRHFILKGHLPLLLHPAPREVAVIGLGLGITLAATERNPEVASVQVIELTPEMVDAHEHLEELTGGVLRSPKVQLRIDDGRNFLAMSGRQFDMVTADPIHPRISGVGYLYTEDYFRDIKRRLKPGGVVCQWMPMYSISLRSFDVAFRSFARVFENASFWYVRGHGLFVATEGPFSVDYARIRARAAAAPVARDLASIEIEDHDALLSHLLMGPAQIREYLAASGDSTVNTDDNAYLEYFTPFEFLEETRDILSALVPFAGFDEALLVNATEAERVGLRRAWELRRARLLAELDEPLR